jgi:3-hydroxyisobutyrate dehydrogenase
LTDNLSVEVLGTGIMGSAMARNLVAAGLRTTVWDRSPEATAPLATVGALVATSPQDAITDARVVITMLPNADAVNSAIVTDGLPTFAPGAVWAQMGTIGVTATAGLDGMVNRSPPDVRFVDAPVSGSKGPAEAGSCSSWRRVRLQPKRSWPRRSRRSAARPSGWATPARAAG